MSSMDVVFKGDITFNAIYGRKWWKTMNMKIDRFTFDQVNLLKQLIEEQTNATMMSTVQLLQCVPSLYNHEHGHLISSLCGNPAKKYIPLVNGLIEA